VIQRVLLLVAILCGRLPAIAVPPELEDIDLPRCEGMIARLLVLDDRWLIACVDPTDAILAEMGRRTDGAYPGHVRRWEEGLAAGERRWSDRDAAIALREEHWTAARLAIGERGLETRGRWRVASDDDGRYADPLRPTRTSKAYVSLDGRVDEGAPATRYAIYVYLELPHRMRSGASYRLALDEDRGTATITWDPDRIVSRAIKVNQVGYLPDDDGARAYLGGWLPGIGSLPIAEGTGYEVVDADTGAVARSGTATLRDRASRCAPTEKEPDPETRPLITGEVVHECPLADLPPGRYHLRIPGMGRSWPFRIGGDVYGEAFFVAMRGLYHQRGSFALEEPYTAWTRKRYHADPVYESDHVPFSFGALKKPEGYSRFDVIGGSLDRSRATPDVVGGWYDAADWDRNLSHYTIAFDLLWLFDFFPERFVDGQLAIPESGNGIPDLLDEVEFGLRIWLRSQDDRGAVSGMVECRTHPRIDAEIPYAFARRTRFSSLLFAAGAAQFARLVEPFDGELARTYSSAARRAFAFGAEPANRLVTRIRARRERGMGGPYSLKWTEEASHVRPFLLLARQQMHFLEPTAGHLEGIEALILDEARPRPYAWPYTHHDYSPWFTAALAGPLADRLPGAIVRRLRGELLDPAWELSKLVDAMPYPRTWPRGRDYWMRWGATDLTNRARCLLLAHQLTGRERYRDAALRNCDFMLGANPLGMSWTTGLGWCYPVTIQHEWSEHDGIPDPMPGLTLYGIDGHGSYRQLEDRVWRGGKDGPVFWDPQRVPVWRRYAAHPTLNTPQCEFTVHETVSSTIFAAGMLMADGWMPSGELRDRRPRQPEVLFGYWYLP